MSLGAFYRAFFLTNTTMPMWFHFQAKCAFWTVHRVHWKCFITARNSCHMSSSLLHPEWNNWRTFMPNAELPAVHSAIWQWVDGFTLRVHSSIFKINSIRWFHSYFSILQFDRQSSIRYSSRRARTLESLASLYEVSNTQRISRWKKNSGQFIHKLLFMLKSNRMTIW